MNVIVLTWDEPIPPGDILASMFREKGCHVSEIKYRPSVKVFDSIKDHVKETIEEIKPDLVFVMKGAGISAAHLKEFRAIHNSKYFLWIVDDPIIRWKMEWPPEFRELAFNSYNMYDRIFIYDSFFVERLAQMGLGNVSFLPCCYDDRYYPMDIEKKYEVIFYGTRFPKREKILKTLVEKQKLTLAGIGWEESPLKGHYIDVDVWNDANLMYNHSKVVLNFHHPQSVNGPNLRCFEVMASGSLLITEPLRDLRDLFREDEEILFYYDEMDLNNKITYYIEHLQKREKIAAQGRTAVKKAHSLSHRVDQIIDVFRCI